MTLIDTFFDGRDIYEKDGFYYIVKYGRIISPAFATLKDAQDHGWKEARLKKTQELDFELRKENATLKKLLEECRHIMSIEADFASCHFEKEELIELIESIDEVLK